MLCSKSTDRLIARWQGGLAGTLAAFLWGLATVMSKAALGAFPPLGLLVIQLLASAAFLWAAVLWRGEALPAPVRALRLSLPGLLQPGLAFVLGHTGLVWTSAGLDALIWSTETVLILALAWLLTGERVAPRLVVLAFLAMAGVALATVSGIGAGRASGPGVVLIAMAVLAAALYTVVSKRQLSGEGPLVLLALHQSAGLALAVTVLGIERMLGNTVGTPSPAGTADWVLAGGSGLVQFALPFWLFMIALRELGTGRASVLLTLPPVMTLVVAWLFLGEELLAVQMAGAALSTASVCGIFLLNSGTDSTGEKN